jgi:hypothetical protein
MNRVPLIGRASKSLPAIIFAFAVLASSPGLSQGVDVPATRLPENATTSIDASYGHLFKTDTDSGGKIERDSASLALSHRIKLSDDLGLNLQGGYQLSSYDFSQSLNGPGAFRWDDIHELRGVALFNWKLNEKWSLITAAAVFLHAESGADFSDGLTAGGGLGFEYRANKNLKLGLLLVAASAIEDSATFLPIPQVDWKFADNWRWRVNVISAFGGRGIGTELSVAPSEELEIAIGITRQRKRFRLDDTATDFPDPASRRGVGEESSIPAFLRIGYKPTPRILLDAMVGVALNGQLRVENRAGDRIESDTFDPAPIVGFSGLFTF